MKKISVPTLKCLCFSYFLENECLQWPYEATVAVRQVRDVAFYIHMWQLYSMPFGWLAQYWTKLLPSHMVLAVSGPMVGVHQVHAPPVVPWVGAWTSNPYTRKGVVIDEGHHLTNPLCLYQTLLATSARFKILTSL